LARKDPEKLIGHDPGKVGIPLVAEVDGRHRNAHNGNHGHISEEPREIRQKQIVAVDDKEIGDNQSGGDQDRVDPKAPEVIFPEGFKNVGQEYQGLPNVASSPAQKHFHHPAVG